MKYRVMAALVLIAILLCGCTEELNTDITVVDTQQTTDDLSVLGEYEDEYLENLVFMLELIYAPKGKVSRDVVLKYAKKYMKDEVAEKFIGNGSIVSNTERAEFSLLSSDMAYGIHQTDGITKAIISFNLQSSLYSGVITVEMRLDNLGKIYDVIVF